MQQCVFKGCGAVGADVAVRIVFGGQKQKMQRFVVFEQGQGVFQCAPGGFASGAVAVEAEINVINLTQQQFDVFGAGGGAQCGHAVADAELRQRYHVHIAFYYQDASGVFNGGAGFKQAVEVAAFVEQGCFRRVEVFGLAFVEHAPAKADDLAALAADGKHNAVAKTVVVFAVFVNHHAAVYQCVAGVGLECFGQWLPAVGGVA